MGSGTRRGFRITTTSYTAHGLTSAVAEPTGDATQFGYDLADRQLTRTNALGRVTTSAYDAGNRRVAVQPPGGGITSTVYDGLDRPVMVVSPVGCISTTVYDDAGRVSRTQKETPSELTVYTWDEDSRLVVAEPVAGLVTLTYRADGRRVQKETPSESTHFIYDLKRLVQETDDGGDPLHEYTSTLEEWGDLVSEYDGADTLYHQYDAVGSTDALVDDDEAVAASYAHRAFGLEAAHSGTAESSFTFVGAQNYYRDPELELYFAGARYYDPAAGRWLNADPIGFQAGDENLFRYVGNNPVNRVDPSGMDSRDAEGRGRYPGQGYSRVRVEWPDKLVWVTGSGTKTVIGGVKGDVEIKYPLLGDPYLQPSDESRLLLNAAFGGYGVTQTQLDLAATSANRYWDALREKKRSLTEEQYEQAIRVFLKLAKDGIEHLSRQLFWSDTERGQAVAEVERWSRQNAKLLAGLPIIGRPLPPRISAITPIYASEQAARAAYIVELGEEAGPEYAIILPGGLGEAVLDLASMGAGGVPGMPGAKSLSGSRAVTARRPGKRAAPAAAPPRRGDKAPASPRQRGAQPTATTSQVVGSLRRDDNLLAKNLGGRIENHTPHHLIGVSEAEKFDVMERAAELGYNINRGNNGINLPNNLDLAKELNLPYHPRRGRHRSDTYTGPVDERLRELQLRYDKGTVTDGTLLDEIRQIEDSIHDDLISGKLRLNTRYPWYPLKQEAKQEATL